MFVDCYSRYTILVTASNHTASTVSDALLRHVVPYFGTPRRLLSDLGREFVGEVWGKLTRSLGIERLLTFPYHPEGNSINERSHRTINNMLRARLLDGTPSRTLVDQIPGIMLALNAMAHKPHGFSASMIAMGREPTLPPDLESNAYALPSLEDPAMYVDALKQLLSLTHQQMAPPPAPVATKPYCEGSLIFVLTTPPERTNKLAPRWKGPFVVKRVPNPYQVVYEDGSTWRTIPINHAKSANLPAAGFPTPIPTPAPPRPALGYLLKSLQRPRPRQPPPPQSASPAEGSSSPPASSKPASPTATPTTGQRSTRGVSAANRNSVPRSTRPPQPASARANRNSGSGFQPRQSARLNPQINAIKSERPAPAPQYLSNTMARTYLLSLDFNQCLGSKEDPYSFSSVHLENLRNGDIEYLVTVQQLIDAIPKTLDPASCFALQGQVSPIGHQHLRHSMRTTLWWLLPSDGDLSQASNGLHYYLACQGRRVVLRGGDVTQPIYEIRMNWVYNPAPPASRCATVDFSDSPVNSSNPPVNSSDTPASAIISAAPGAPLAPPHPKKSRKRRRRKNRRSANENSAPRSAVPVTPDDRWANENSASQGTTQPQLAANDPTQMMSTPVYQH